jgi:hypothetical protein
MGVTKKQLDAWAQAGEQAGKRVRAKKSRGKKRSAAWVARAERDREVLTALLHDERVEHSKVIAELSKVKDDLRATSDDLFRSRAEATAFEKAHAEAAAGRDRLATINHKLTDDAGALANLCLELFEVIGLQADPTSSDKVKAAKLAHVLGKVHLLRPFV